MAHDPFPMPYRKQPHGHASMSTTGRNSRPLPAARAIPLNPSPDRVISGNPIGFTREVLNGLLRIGFEQHQLIIWDKGRTVWTLTLYWFQHEPCWFMRKKNAPWFGKAGENSMS